MLSIAAERTLPTLSRSSRNPRIQAKTLVRALHLTRPLLLSLPRQGSGTCATCHSASSSPPAVFAYLSRRRNRQVISLAMSGLSRRDVSTPSSSGSKSPVKPSDPHAGHSHSHGDGHGHDHDHSHGGIFHSHAHDHSEGAEQIIQAFSKGKLDRGTRITLLGRSSALSPTLSGPQLMYRSR